MRRGHRIRRRKPSPPPPPNRLRMAHREFGAYVDDLWNAAYGMHADDYHAMSALLGEPRREVTVTDDGKPCYRYTWGKQPE